jgi:predicted DNA-binding protein
MTNDALERLKRRQRPSVPERDISLAAPRSETSLDTSTSRHLDSKHPDILEPRTLEVKGPGILESGNLETKSPESLDIKTKQTTMRLDAGVSDRLHILCQRHGISREVLIEAMFLHCEQENSVLEAVLSTAQERNEQRLSAANRKRAKTMIEKFGN